MQEGGPLPYELDGELNTVRPVRLRSTLQGAFTAHTKYDARPTSCTRSRTTLAWDHVRHIMIDRLAGWPRTTRVPVADAPMMHDFALTESTW